jgi:hypothetical protein
MPYKDPEAKKNYMRQWRLNMTNHGYGKWLYERRKLRFADAERFREALDAIATDATITPEGCPEPWRSTLIEWATIANHALEESRKAEEALGKYHGKRSIHYRSRELAVDEEA